MKNYRNITLVVLLLIFFLIGTFVMQYLQGILQDTTMIMGVDLYPRWVGTQAILQGESPYSITTRQLIWLEIYGSTDTPNGNIFGFYYPPAITTLLMPFVLSGLSVKMAAVLWCALLWAVLSTALLSWGSSIRHLPKAYIILPALLISSWFFRPAFSNYLLGQYALLSVFFTIAVWYCFENDQPIWAGIFGALALVKPTLTIIPIGFILIQNWGKSKGILALTVSSLLLYLPPTIMIGWWLPDFLADISTYVLENRVAWSAIDMTTPPGILWILISIILVRLAYKKKDSNLTLGAAFALNAVIAPHSADYDLVAFIPLLIYIGNNWITDEKKQGLFITLFFVLIWFPWLSLIVIIQTIDINAVEAWYRFIWLSYPLIILLISLFVSIYHPVKDRK